MADTKYRVVIAQSGKIDVKDKKKYILSQFKYREYAENFSRKIKESVKQLEIFPNGRETTGFQYRGYEIYIEPCESHLLFFVVDDIRQVVTVLRVLQDGMDWQFILKRWIRENV